MQAGTGTGKSLAYLVPALLVDGPVVVSTATLALQSQLVDHDLPRLADAASSRCSAEGPHSPFSKGATTTCVWPSWRAPPTKSPQTLCSTRARTRWVGEAGRLGKQIQRIREWALESATGDRDELDPGVEDMAWRQVSMPARECVGAAKCPYGEECFAEAARERARSVDIVVTNHSLLAIDMLAERHILPPHKLLVVDEAHELADRVSASAQAELTTEAVDRAARRARRLVEPDVSDALTEAGDALAIGLGETPAGRLTSVRYPPRCTPPARCWTPPPAPR